MVFLCPESSRTPNGDGICICLCAFVSSSIAWHVLRELDVFLFLRLLCLPRMRETSNKIRCDQDRLYSSSRSFVVITLSGPQVVSTEEATEVRKSCKSVIVKAEAVLEHVFIHNFAL